MRLSVRLFGVLADTAGADTKEVELSGQPTAADVLRAVAQTDPRTASLLGSVKVAVNLEVVEDTHPISAQDEIALLPPTAGGSGGSSSILVGLRERPDPQEALRAVSAPSDGATVLFQGSVRSPSDGREVESLDYTAYEEMAEKVMEDIATRAASKWGLGAVVVLHAVGVLGPGETTFVVACAAPHRAEAFEACRWVVDEVKERVPVWKKERGKWGERWIGS